MTQVILNGHSIGNITNENLATFLACSSMVVVSRTTKTICLEHGSATPSRAKEG